MAKKAKKNSNILQCPYCNSNKVKLIKQEQRYLQSEDAIVLADVCKCDKCQSDFAVAVKTK